MAGKIFINYRRDDDSGFVQALLTRLEQTFNSDQLFIDIDGIEPGLDFVSVLEQQVAQCDVLLAVIGKGWIGARDEANARRLDNPEDFVRIEIASALTQGKRVIPVLVANAQMPRSDELPEPLKPLARRGAVRLTHERFRADTAGLISALQRVLADVERLRQADQNALSAGQPMVMRAEERATDGNSPNTVEARDNVTQARLQASAQSRSRVRLRSVIGLAVAALAALILTLPYVLQTAPKNIQKSVSEQPGPIPKPTGTIQAAISRSNSSAKNDELPPSKAIPIPDSSDYPFGIGIVDARERYNYTNEMRCILNGNSIVALRLGQDRSGTTLFFDDRRGIVLNLVIWQIPSTDAVAAVHIHDRIDEVETRLGQPDLPLSPKAAIYFRGGFAFRFDYDGINRVRTIWKTKDPTLVQKTSPAAVGLECG